ncbi:Calcium-transporting ATPase type 2C member 1, partial [Taenia solium]
LSSRSAKGHQPALQHLARVFTSGLVDKKTGLTNTEALRRYEEIGPNEFQAEPPDPLWLKYLKQFFEPMIGLLIISAFVSILMGQIDDAVSISTAILIVVTVGFIQGYRSEKAIESLKKLMPPNLREGKLHSLVASNLVPGDIIYLSLGDRVPADLRIIESSDLRIDESNLTGETKAVAKRSNSLPSQPSDPCLSKTIGAISPSKSFQTSASTTVFKRNDSFAGSWGNGETIINFGNAPTLPLLPPKQIEGAHCLTNIGFMGTLVCSGNAIGVVIATGEHSEFGEVFKMMQTEQAPRTPLQKSMDRLGKHLSIISGVIILGIVFLGLAQGRNLLELITVAVSLAVAAIPEGLPIVVTVTLAIGQMRMAARNAIIKKLPAVETLGCVNVICADKTGTMTKNEMTVTQVVTSALERANVSGVGYSPADGEVTLECDDRPHSALRHANLHRLVEIGALCNNASLKDGILCGQPTEGALLCLAAKMRIPDPRLTNTRIKEWPFNSDQKLMVVQVAPTRLSKPCTSTYFIKGAPDRVIPLCAYYRSAAIAATTDLGSVTPLGESERLNILAEASRMAASGGLRVLALAEGSSVDRDFIFAGLVGLLDPPRPDVESAVETCYRSGVRVIMITGDAKETACAIGSRLSLYRPGDMCLSGQEVETMDMHQLQSQIHCVTVFYRTGPRHKCKIVKALQNRGLVVAMTGDGVNDAVALKSADIGVAMGASGTDVCKEAADVVLLDDAFSSVLAAMEEGKALFANICNFIRFQLSTSIAALSLIAVSTTLSLPNPLNAMQILYINILMDGPPAQSLGVEPPDADVVNQPPRHVQKSILDRHLIKSVLISALMIVCGTLFIFHREMAADGKVTPRDTTMTFTCFVLFDMFNALSCRSQKKSVFKIGFFSNRVFVVAVSLSLIGQICVIYFPPLQSVFQTEAIFASDWLLLLAISSSVFVVSEYRPEIDYFDKAKVAAETTSVSVFLR